MFLLTGILSSQLINFTNHIIDDAILPFISNEKKDDNPHDKPTYELEDYTIQIGSSTVKVGAIAIASIRLVMLYLLIVLFTKLF
jgi:hypothetical protein